MGAPRNIAEPRPGWFKMRLTRGGPWFGAMITDLACCCTPNGGDENKPHRWRASCDRHTPEKLTGEINGEPADVDRIWTTAREITEAEYRYLVADAEWCRTNAPDAPEARPRQAVDLHTLPPIEP